VPQAIWAASPIRRRPPAAHRSNADRATPNICAPAGFRPCCRTRGDSVRAWRLPCANVKD
jgi:hypothetical protein